MKIFITGTDTDIGKTLVSSWICLHTGYDYFKPIQTGGSQNKDSSVVLKLANVKIHPEIYLYQAPLSPHLAAYLENEEIDINTIKLPNTANLIVEGAGGLLVPINQRYLMIDLVKQLDIPVIIVSSSRLGTINHTLLSLEALKNRQIKTLGVIMTGQINQSNVDSIEFYGNTKVLAQIPFLDEINTETLSQITLTKQLKKLIE